MHLLIGGAEAGGINTPHMTHDSKDHAVSIMYSQSSAADAPYYELTGTAK